MQSFVTSIACFYVVPCFFNACFIIVAWR